MTFNVEDYYTYIKERNTFPVSFLNVNKLSLNEVTDIFKIYGDLKVIQSKSPTGYCFVNFFNEESARNCVLSMKNHDKIKLCRPNKRDPLPRSELNKENNNDDKIIKTSISDRLKINPVDDNSDDKEKTLIIDKPTSSPSSPSPPPTPIHPAQLIEQKKNLLQSFKSFNNLSEQLIEEQQKKVELFDDKIVDKSSVKEHMLLEKNKKDEKIIQAMNEQFIETDDVGPVSNVPHDLSPINSTAINTCETNSSHSGLLEKIEEEEEEEEEEGIPCGALSTCHHTFIDNDDVFYTDENYLTFNVTDKPMQVIEAQDIMIAGIPAELGTIGILHYLEKFNPILITNIKRTYTEPSVRYCHVYFTTPQDAENAEIYFDDKLFGSSRIIALRPDSLAQQILKVA